MTAPPARMTTMAPRDHGRQVQLRENFRLHGHNLPTTFIPGYAGHQPRTRHSITMEPTRVRRAATEPASLKPRKLEDRQAAAQRCTLWLTRFPIPLARDRPGQ